MCSQGRPCDYSALSYALLTGNSGIQIPCTALYPNGKERQYTNGVFNTDPGYCQTYGHDLVTGRPITRSEYLANNPQGRALIKAADYVPPAEQPDAAYPLWLTTGRVVYHWHTRTKTARSPELNAAAPDAFVQLSALDAIRYGIQEGDLVEVKSRRGQVQQPARVGDIEPGMIFMPFHYSYWDRPDCLRAANELTLTVWDPVSKQPHLKYAAVHIRKIAPS